MKIGLVRVITAAVDNRRRRIIYMVTLFMGAVAIGFLLELSTYETLRFAKLPETIANSPRRWKGKPSEYQLPSLNLDQVLNNDFSSKKEKIEEGKHFVLQEQSENETKVIEKVHMPPKFYEQPTLLNLNPFSWEMLNESLCALNPAHPKDARIMPVLVHTARNHFDERLALRRTWGSVPLYKKWDVRLVFLLGRQDRGSNPEVNQLQHEQQEKRLAAEQNIFGDIVIGSFIDSYRNLTYKHIMGYKWVLNFCPNATFVLKVDDDIFIDILRWLDWRSADLDKVEEIKTAKIPDLYCHTFGDTKPFREVDSKWYASVEDWPNDYYPDYCSGWGYGITVDLIEKLYSMTQHIKFFWIDDVFATGALMDAMKKKLGWTPEYKHIWGNVTINIMEYRPMCNHQNWNATREFRAVAAVPRGDLFERDMMCLWNKTLHDSTYKWS